MAESKNEECILCGMNTIPKERHVEGDCIYYLKRRIEMLEYTVNKLIEVLKSI